MTPLEAGFAAIDANTTNPLFRAKARGLLRGYDARWGNQDYALLHTEVFATAPVYNPNTKGRSLTFLSAGLIDKVALDPAGAMGIIDHKTTSEAIEDPNATYWQQLIVEAQPSHYMLLGWVNGQKFEWAVWDVVRKPGISPRQIKKGELGELLAKKEWFGFPVNPDTLAQAAVEQRESETLYEYRLAHACTTEEPERYFQQRSVPRLDAELMEHAQTQWEYGQEILTARQNNRWPKNSKSCIQYKSPCAFLGVCSGYDTIESDKWTRKAQVHRELPVLDGDGRNLLTKSRIESFASCRRKHYYEYEIGLERVSDEEKDSLIFGSLWHRAMDGWWSMFMEVSDVNANGVQASAV